MLKKLATLAVVTCVSVTGVAGIGNAAPEGISNAGLDPLSWTDCTDQVEDSTGIQCAEISVPADWHQPQDEHITVGLGKLPAKDPEQRVGSLLVNLGGPLPMVEGLPNVKDSLAELTTWFDVIVFDPRGIGTSSPVACPDGPSFPILLFSTGEQTWQEFEQANREWEADCQRAAGPLARNLDAWQIAHDMEAIRAALGEGKLNYYGNSYGTVFGQAYAELFPTRINRMFLDSTFDHTERSPARLTAPLAEVIGKKFQRFGEWCEIDAECALYPENARDVWDDLMAQAQQHPLPAPGAGADKTVGPGQLRVSTMIIDDPADWPTFAESLAKARAGDASDLYLTASDVPYPNTVEDVLYCANVPFEGGWDAIVEVERELRDVEPRIGWLMARQSLGRCTGMQGQGTFPPHPIAPEGLPPVLLVNGLLDDTTPPAHGRAVAGQLPGSVWIGADADHAVYLDGNRCVRDIVHRYLRTGDLPAPEHICPATGSGTP